MDLKNVSRSSVLNSDFFFRLSCNFAEKTYVVTQIILKTHKSLSRQVLETLENTVDATDQINL